MEKTKKHTYSKEKVRGASGVLLFLFCLLVALSPSTHLWFLSYPLIATLGYVGHYAFILLGLFFGAALPFWNKLPHPKARIYAGYGLLILGGTILASDLGMLGKESASDFSPIFNALSEGYAKPSAALLADPRLCGGLLGYLLSGVLNLAGRFLPLFLASLILLSSLIVFFFPLLKKAYLSIRAKKAINKAKPAKAKESGNALDVGEEDPDFAFHAKEVEGASEEEKEALLAKEKQAFDAWDFRPSSSLPFASRSESKESAPIAQEGPLPDASVSLNTRFHSGEIEEPEFPFPAPETKETASNAAQAYEEAKPEGKEDIPETPSFDLSPDIPFASPSSYSEEETPEPSLSQEEQASAPQEENLFEVSDEPLSNDVKPAELPPLPGAPALEEKPVADETASPAPSPAPETKKDEPINKEDAVAIPLPKYVFPDESMLDEPKVDEEAMKIASEEAERNMFQMNETLSSLHAGAKVISYKIGPSVTRYDVELEPGVLVNSIYKFEADISRCLAGRPTRYVPIVQGKTTSSFEIGNLKRMPVCFKEVFSVLPKGEDDNMVVPFGKSIDGNVVYSDLSAFPHMLVAGTTGSGKSIFIHSMLLTLLMRNRPEDLKLIMVDPKQVEFTAYDEMPNLLCPTITSAEKANVALHKLADLMDRRFELLRKAKVRDIRSYNKYYAPANNRRKLPFIVVVVDEFADLATQCKDVSEPIQRLGQKGRACGIHMIIATQRPDANTISGTIKANLPVTVCLMVKNSIDSNVVLHAKGGESLLDHGDMLIECPKLGRGLIRAQGAMMGEYTELMKVPNFIRSQMRPIYDPEFLNLEPDQQTDAATLVEMPSGAQMKGMADEEKYQTIKSVIMQQESTSISQIQRNFGVGFPRAGKIIARLQKEGIVATQSDAPGSSKGLKVLVHIDPNEGAVPNGSTPGSLSSASTSYEEE